MKKPTLRLLAGLATTCTLVVPLSACSFNELTAEVCQQKMADGTLDRGDYEECYALIQEQERKAAEEAEAEFQQLNDNLVATNFKADYEHGAYVITMDIENKNDSDVGDITVTIPYGERYQDNYGDTQVEDMEFTESILLIPAKGTYSIKKVLPEDYAKQKMEAIDEKKITVTTSGNVVTPDKDLQSVSAADFDVKFSTSNWGAEYTITNNTQKKVESVSLEGYVVDKDGNYDCGSTYCSTGSVSASYLKPGQTSEKSSIYGGKLIDLKVTNIQFATE